MNILLVEDDLNKINRIQEFLRFILPEATISVSRSYGSALRNLNTLNLDFLLLDMSLPVYDISGT